MVICQLYPKFNTFDIKKCNNNCKKNDVAYLFVICLELFINKLELY